MLTPSPVTSLQPDRPEGPKEKSILCTDLTLVNTDGRERYVEPLRCRSWRCEYCRPHRKSQLMALAASGQATAFITLTSSPETADTPAAAARVLVIAWRKVRREAMRRYGYDGVPFLAVFEATRRGAPHLHILARVAWIDQAWLSKRMAYHAKAPIVDIRRVKSQKDLVAYLAKYVGKEPHQFDHCKRYWRSGDWELKPEDERPPRSQRQGVWTVVRKNFHAYLWSARWEGCLVIEEGDGCIIRQPSWHPP